MFHTFDGSESASRAAPGRQGPGGERGETTGRRVTTARACTSCRHRKIKCDGERPCEACRWYRKADQCHYAHPRTSDSKRVKEVSATLDTYRRVLGTLFPNVNVESLDNLPREKLLEVLAAQSQQSPGSIPQPSSSPTATLASVATHGDSTEDDNLELLQTMPAEPLDRQHTGSTDPDQGLSDDVNGLALCARQPSSYLGISSTQAVLKVIVLLNPGCASYLSRKPTSAGEGAAYGAPSGWLPHAPVAPLQPQHLPLTEMQFLDAYFLIFHAFCPMIDEKSFRETYLAGHRRDKPWLALLNIVLALGSVAATNPNDTTHQIYYQRCEENLGLSALGNPQIEIIQTLGLISGWYCHYLSQPELAQSLMGAALRMATARGLHKEPIKHDQVLDPATAASLDIKRRTWWSLFCMDTWAGMTLGRPSMGRTGLTITVKPPHGRDEETLMDVLPLVENIRFARIATEIQELLAAAPLGKHQAAQMDAQLLDWWENLPAILKDYEPCPERIKTVRNVMRWRYYNQRILLYRPTLLSYAMRRVSYLALRTEERTAIEKCREMAELSIQHIAATAQTNQLGGWNAVWWTFLASMVPLLGLFINDPTATDPRASIRSCQAQVETAMLTFARMHALGHTAKTSLDAVSRIFEASKHVDNLAVHGAALPVLAPAVDSVRRDATALGVMPQPEMNRAMTSHSEAAHLDALIYPFVHDANDQQMWDYLSWGDNSMWPGLVTDIAMA
ncbi:hypothetical protein HFD88_000287 [Aspergillus terreus]|nr:hypothetical protein HFD88_000287 [Aspergillus terreus]